MLSNRRSSPGINDQGFTLIELMIVMVVLGILAGFVMFALAPFESAASDAKTTANEDTCRTARALAFTTPDPTDDANTYLEDNTGC